MRQKTRTVRFGSAAQILDFFRLPKDGPHYRRIVAGFKRVFAATMFFGTDQQTQGTTVIDLARFHFFDRMQLWFNAGEEQNPSPPCNAENEIVLSEAFYREIDEHRIPVEREAVAALAHAPGVLDFYMWLVWKSWTVKGHPARVPLVAPTFLSQPAMSRALERLRDMFGDPLLVRSGRGYERTVRGERVLRELETLMPRLEAMVRGEEFDPARSQERFRVAMTDHAAMILMPSLMVRVRRAAADVKLEVSAWHPQAYEDVIAGRLDAALSAEVAPPTLETEVIFDMDFVCLIGSALRVRTRRFTLAQYLQLPHALVRTLEGQQTPVDRTLAQLGAKRHVVVILPFFVSAIFAIAQSDLILTVPRRLAKVTAAMAGVRIVEPPPEIKVFPYFMAWHPRLTSEPAHAWFRAQVRNAARTIPAF